VGGTTGAVKRRSLLTRGHHSMVGTWRTRPALTSNGAFVP
jgi:hypothetical protein